MSSQLISPKKIEGKVVFGKPRTALDGTPAKYSPERSPYYYDKFALYRNGWDPGDTCIKSDDIIHQENYSTFCMRLFHNRGQIFTSREPRLVQVLLSMLLERPVILTGIEEECIGSRGYPHWYFWYRDPSPEDVQFMRAAFYEILLERDKTYEEDIEKTKRWNRMLYMPF